MPDDASFAWSDPLLLDEQLDDDERLIRDTTRQYAQDKLMAVRSGQAHDPGSRGEPP